MAITPVNIGAAPNDGTGDPLRTAFDKVNDNFTDVQSQITTAAGQATDAQAAADAAQITANNAIPQSQAGVPSGVATLDAGGKVPKTQITLNASDVGAEAIGTAAAEVGLLDAELAPVAKSGDYADLLNTPTIPGAQVNSDWDAVSGVAQILNKPVITPFAETLLDDADAAAMRTTLGAAGAADTVNITGDQIIDGIKTFNNKVVSNAAPVFRARASITQNLTSATAIKAVFDTEDFDTASCFASSRFAPNVSGYYDVSGAIRGAGDSWTALAVYLYKNGSVNVQLCGFTQSASNAIQTVGFGDKIFLNGTTDYIEIYVLMVGTAPKLDVTSFSSCSMFSAGLIQAT